MSTRSQSYPVGSPFQYIATKFVLLEYNIALAAVSYALKAALSPCKFL